VGQKVNPKGFRIGVYRDWDSQWFARRSNYAQLLFEDLSIRRYLDKRLAQAEVSVVKIAKAGDAIRVDIFSARPGLVIGKQGREIESLRRDLTKLLRRGSVEVSVKEVENPDLDAMVVAKSIAEQLEKRASFKKVMKKAATTTMKAGAKGIKIRCSGRLGGAEIARDEWIRVGSTPLHTLRSDVDYALAEAHTTYGVIGVKVWICRGEYALETLSHRDESSPGRRPQVRG
jgi:small subunit ribosomal protein S3